MALLKVALEELESSLASCAMSPAASPFALHLLPWLKPGDADEPGWRFRRPAEYNTAWPGMAS